MNLDEGSRGVARTKQVEQRVGHLLFPKVYANAKSTKKHKHQTIFAIRKAAATSEKAAQQQAPQLWEEGEGGRWCEQSAGSAEELGKVVVEGQGEFKELSHPLVFITRPGSWQDFEAEILCGKQAAPSRTDMLFLLTLTFFESFSPSFPA